MTRLKKIRQMSDEDLGKFFRKIFHIATISSKELSSAFYYAVDCQDCPLHDSCERNFHVCSVNLESWLNSEVEE